MAIDTVLVTKFAVSEPQKGMVVVTLKMVCEESGLEVLNQNFSQPKKDAMTVGDVQLRFYAEMQAAIAEWNREQIVFDSAALDNVVANLNSALAP